MDSSEIGLTLSTVGTNDARGPQKYWQEAAGHRLPLPLIGRRAGHTFQNFQVLRVLLLIFCLKMTVCLMLQTCAFFSQEADCSILVYGIFARLVDRRQHSFFFKNINEDFCTSSCYISYQSTNCLTGAALVLFWS